MSLWLPAVTGIVWPGQFTNLPTRPTYYNQRDSNSKSTAMPEIVVSPETAQSALDHARAGDKLVFQPGRYGSVLTLLRKRGTAAQPIVIQGQPGAILTMGIAAEDFREEGNRRAKQIQDEGHQGSHFPGLWPWLLDGRLVLRDCEHVTVTGLRFEKSWPTHIAIEDCRAVRIEDCRFEDATFAIGATGPRTYGIHINACHWLQDPVPGRIWRQIPWQNIHGAPPDDPPVNIATDWRLFDGDFFRASEIAGGVTIAHCRIGQAFNAIHCFNDPGEFSLSRDLHVHDCVFFEIRDNVFEAENVAENWWFHHNRIHNAHKWFSFELRRSRHFYLFSNLAWFTSIQGPDVGDDNRGGGAFKLAKRVSPPYGPTYVFNNSIAIRSDYLRKGILAGLVHRNNAVLCVSQAGSNHDAYPDFFGDLAAAPSDVKRRFVTDWATYDIEMAHDVVHYPGWPQALIAENYPIHPSSKGADPRFVDPASTELDGTGLKLGPSSPCAAIGGPIEVTLPDGDTWSLEAGSDAGAWQGDQLLVGPRFRTVTAA